MQAITPLSGASDITIDTTNYPGLKVCCRPEYVTDGVDLTDPISGLVFADSGFLNNGDGTFTIGTGSLVTASDNFPMPATKNILHIFVGTYTETGGIMYVGAPQVGPGWGLGTQGSGSANGYVTKNGSNYLDEPNMTKSSVTSGVLLLYVDMSGNTSYHIAHDGTSVEASANAATTGTITPISGSTAAHLLFKPNVDQYGHYIFYLTDDLTTDFLTSCAAWMFANPTKIYPGLRGLS